MSDLKKNTFCFPPNEQFEKNMKDEKMNASFLSVTRNY